MTAFKLSILVLSILVVGLDVSNSMFFHKSSDCQGSHCDRRDDIEALLVVQVTLNFTQSYLENFVEAKKSVLDLLDITVENLEYGKHYNETVVNEFVKRVSFSLKVLLDLISPNIVRNQTFTSLEDWSNLRKHLKKNLDETASTELKWMLEHGVRERFPKFLLKEISDSVKKGSALKTFIEEADSTDFEFMKKQLKTDAPFTILSRKKIQVRMVDFSNMLRKRYNWQEKTEIWLPITDIYSFYEKLRKLANAWVDAHAMLATLGAFCDAVMETSRMSKSGNTPPILRIGELRNLIQEMAESFRFVDFPANIAPHLKLQDRINPEQRNVMKMLPTRESNVYLLLIPFIDSQN